MFTAFLIKYAEIGIKGKNRYLFEDALIAQIKHALKKCEGEFSIRKTMGRIFVEAQGDFDYDETVERLRRVFGIWGICPVIYVEDQGWEKLCEEGARRPRSPLPYRRVYFRNIGIISYIVCNV